MDNRRLPFGGSAVIVVRRDDAGVDGFDSSSSRGRARRCAGAARRRRGRRSTRPLPKSSASRADVPRFGVDMDADTIPLEAGIEDRAISQTKGCYVGQEIIIRVLHRGQGRVARRLVGLTFEPRRDGSGDGRSHPRRASARSGA